MGDQNTNEELLRFRVQGMGENNKKILQALASCNDMDVKIALKFMVGSELELPDVLSLKGSDIDFQTNTIRFKDRTVNYFKDLFTPNEITVMRRRKNGIFTKHCYASMSTQITRACKDAGVVPSFTPKIMKRIYYENLLLSGFSLSDFEKEYGYTLNLLPILDNNNH